MNCKKEKNLPISEVVYLGPAGTYAYEVAQKRYHQTRKLLSCESVMTVCREVAANPARRGIVPIVNSSAGMIYDTIDSLLDNKLSLCIEEELSINVRLALLGRKGEKIEKIYSHFAPLAHCSNWLRKTYPNIDPDKGWIEEASTGAAAREVANNANSAAICNKRAAAIYGLDVLKYPIPGLSAKNVTHFFIIGKNCNSSATRANKTSLAVHLANKPGALFDFLKPLSATGLNLSRLISRPIPGRPTEFAFFMDIDESIHKARLRKALSEAEKSTTGMRIVGSYPSFRSYTS